MRHELHNFSRHDFAYFSKRVVKTLLTLIWGRETYTHPHHRPPPHCPPPHCCLTLNNAETVNTVTLAFAAFSNTSLETYLPNLVSQT